MYVFGDVNFRRGIVNNYNYGGMLTLSQIRLTLILAIGAMLKGKFISMAVVLIFPVGKEEMYRPWFYSIG